MALKSNGQKMSLNGMMGNWVSIQSVSINCCDQLRTQRCFVQLTIIYSDLQSLVEQSQCRETQLNIAPCHQTQNGTNSSGSSHLFSISMQSLEQVFYLQSDVSNRNPLLYREKKFLAVSLGCNQPYVHIITSITNQIN